MIKRLLALWIVSALLMPSGFAFRDISPNSTLAPAIQHLVKKGALKDDGRFFRPDSHVPKGMFWETVILNTGFNASSATFDTALPPNIEEDHPLAQILREAIRRGFLSDKTAFDENEHLTRIQAIKHLLAVYGIAEPTRVSPDFRVQVSGISKKSNALPFAEAALASGILTTGDVRPLRPYAPLNRRDFVQWLHRYDQNGKQKKSTIRKVTSNASVRENSRQRANTKRSSRSTARQRLPKRQQIQVQQIQGIGAMEPRPSGTGLVIPNGRVFESIFREIQSRYKFSEDLDKKKQEDMIDAAIAAMVKEMGDKYSSYIEPDKSKDFREGLNGKFEGIGAYVEMMDAKLTITSPITGSPAEAAGVLPGDVVTHVNTESIEGLSIHESVKKIKGPAGTSVELTIQRGSGSLDINIIRGKITVPPITLKWQNAIPIIGVHQFNRDTHTKFLNIWEEEIASKNPRGLIIDLRNNPGGLLTSAVKMGEIFLEKGQDIFSVEEKTSSKMYKAGLTGPLKSLDNIVVLQNKGSASASEIFSGMMKDYDKATIVGSTSLGKGTVQQVLNYQNGGILKLTIAKWLTPKGHWIHEKGVEPDVMVEDQTPEERKNKLDRQLDRAVQVIFGR